MISVIARTVATCGGLGYAPRFPGTIGSLGAFLAYWGFSLWRLSFFWQVSGLAGLYLLGLWAADVVQKQEGMTDPQIIVIDEWVAMWVVCLMVPPVTWLHVVAFLIFRFFDIAKPWPISVAERFDGAHGIMADDIGAAAATICVINLLLWGISLS